MSRSSAYLNHSRANYTEDLRTCFLFTIKGNSERCMYVSAKSDIAAFTLILTQILLVACHPCATMMLVVRGGGDTSREVEESVKSRGVCKEDPFLSFKQARATAA